MELRLGSTGTNSAKGDQISHILRGDGVEHLRSNRHARAGEIDVELAGDAETLVDVEGLVNVGVVDQTLPSNGGTGLLEVGAHNNAEVVGESLGDSLEALAVLDSGLGVVDRAGSNDNEKAVIALLDHINSLLAAGADGLDGLGRLNSV